MRTRMLWSSALLAVVVGLMQPAMAQPKRHIGNVAKPPEAMVNPIVADYVETLAVQQPMNYKGLTVFPLTTKNAFPLGGFHTLDQALEQKSLIVKELPDGAEVNKLRLENTSDKYVFIMGGEVLKGAKQDRTLQNDLLVPPHSGKLEVNAFCTEQGRWVEKSGQFESSGIAVPNSVRSAAKVGKAQDKVWESIARNQAKLSVSTPTGAAKDTYADKKVKADLKPFLDRLADLPDRSVGVAAAFGDKLVAVDLFGNQELLKRLYPKLLRSYAVDVVGDAWHGSTSPEQIREWLGKAGKANWRQGETDGVGLGLEFDAAPLHGSALLYKEMLVHSDMVQAEPKPEARPGLLDNEQRRQQRNR